MNAIQIKNTCPLDELFDFYQQMGFSLVKLSKGEKIPIEKDWNNILHKDKAEWEEWIDQGYNVGLLCGEPSGVVVVDIDSTEIPTELKNRLTTTLYQTTSRGHHFIFKYEPGISSMSNCNLDILSDNKQAVVPPSICGDKQRKFPCLVEPVKMSSELKDWLLNIKFKDRGKTATQIPRIIPEGGRNNTLFSAAVHMRKGGFEPESIKAALLVENSKKCGTPLLIEEISTIANSAGRYEARKELGEEDIKNCNRIASQLQAEQSLLFCDGIWYEYKDGVFLKVKEDHIRRLIKVKLGGKFTTNKSNEIIHSLRVDIALNDTDELNATELLNLKNGMFDLNTLELTEHSPKYKSTIQLPVNYNPSAQCPKWYETLRGIFPTDIDKADMVQEFYGLCLTKEQKFEKALFLLGEGANGKSTILHIIQQILGKRNYSSVPLELFNNPHYTANFYNRLANISIETNAKSSVYDSLMKAVISGDTISADFKYQNVIQFNPFCKLIFALNQMPQVSDKTDAFYRRLIIIKMNRQFAEEEQNKNLKFELEAEMDGIFAWMLEGLKRLRTRGYFEISGAIKTEVEQYRKENNNVITFVEEECRLTPDGVVSKRSLFDAYVVWCKSCGCNSSQIRKFGKELSKHNLSIGEGRDSAGTSKVWLGIELVDLPNNF